MPQQRLPLSLFSGFFSEIKCYPVGFTKQDISVINMATFFKMYITYTTLCGTNQCLCDSVHFINVLKKQSHLQQMPPRRRGGIHCSDIMRVTFCTSHVHRGAESSRQFSIMPFTDSDNVSVHSGLFRLTITGTALGECLPSLMH